MRIDFACAVVDERTPRRRRHGYQGSRGPTAQRRSSALDPGGWADNHLTIDLVTSVFPRGTAPWSRLIRKIWRSVLAQATPEGIDLVVTDVYPGTPNTTEYWRETLDVVRSGGGTPMLVQLTCSCEVLFARLQSESRRQTGKLTDARVLEAMLARSDLFATLPFEQHLRVDTTSFSPAESAAQIAAHYSLPPRPAG
jgi:chloramphenicol 3-O-phosphotransferase